MKSRKAFFPFLLVGLLLLLFSCKESTVERWIDNPTDKEIIIALDGSTLNIPAKSGINHPFEYGKHILSYNGSSVNFMVKPSDTDGFMNPTQSNYVLFKNVYLNKSDSRTTEGYTEWLKKQIDSDTEIIVNDSLKTLSVPFKVFNTLFVEKSEYNWDYNLDETIPTNVFLKNAIVNRRNRSLASDKNYQEGKFQTVKSKLFRESDFLDYLKRSGVTESISFPENKIKLNDFPKVQMPNIDVDKITCESGRAAIKKALENWNKWLTLEGGDFMKEYLNNIRLTGLKILTPTLENDCHEKHNKDYTYKQAAAEVDKVINGLAYSNFFIY